MKRMQLILAMVFALLCVCFSGSFAFADSENTSAANANEASCETDAIVGTVKIDGRPTPCWRVRLWREVRKWPRGFAFGEK